MNWFEVDKKGLGSLLERRGPGFILYELIQNAIDEEGVDEVLVDLGPGPKRGMSVIAVTDNSPEGFRRLSDAWTLFATSYKAGNPTQRGRFNLGEKLVLALCEKAQITTTKGAVLFDEKGRHQTNMCARGVGTSFVATIRMTEIQRYEALAAVRRMIPPKGIKIYVPANASGFSLDGPQILPRPMPVAEFRTSLQTEFADDEGILRRTKRMTDVAVYEAADSVGWVYEMGVPIVETGDRWHYDIGQKVPQGLERDNVPPAFLRQLRTEALNALYTQVTPDDVNETWVRDAVASKEVSPDAFRTVLDQRFGENRVMADPTDPEATKRAVAAGFTPVYGNQLSQGERDNIRTFRETGWDPVVPAGQSEFATKKLFSPSGKPAKVLNPADYTSGQRRVVEYTRAVAMETLGKPVDVIILNEMTLGCSAAYRPVPKGLDEFPGLAALFAGRPLFMYNLGRLGRDWFEDTSSDGLKRINWLIIHELAHDMSLDHLSSDFHDGLCEVGASLAIALTTGRLSVASYGF